MNIMGKLIGAFLGVLLIHHPLGLFIGLAIGHVLDKGWLRLGGGFLHATPRSCVEPLFALAGALSKSDGRVSEQEIAATEQLMTRMQLDANQRQLAIARFSAGKQAEFPIQSAIVELRAWCSGRRDLAYMVLDMLLDIVYAEGVLANSKLTLLRKLCSALGVTEHELSALSAIKGYGPVHSGPGAQQSNQGARSTFMAGHDPYAVLGLTRDASDREIKRAYRKLISQHHPDKLGSQDIPQKLLHRAEERAREINAAYEKIKLERGIK